MKRRKNHQRAGTGADFALLRLETRMLLSGSPLTVTLASGVLTVTGTVSDDQIEITRSGNTWGITNGDWSTSKTGSATKLSVNGGAGDDWIAIDAVITAASTILGGTGDDVVFAGSGATSINGGSGNDSLMGCDGNDTLVGDIGNDDLEGNAGADKLLGGAGDDWLGGGDGNDSITADAGDDWLSGGDGNDTLLAGAGNDFASGESGDDSMVGDIGDDVLDAGEGNDALFGNAGNDWLDGYAGNDSLQGGLGADSLNGGDDVDLLDYSDHTATQKVTANLAGGIAGMLNENDVIGDDCDNITGSAGNDSLTGNGLANTLRGGAGNDTLLALGGDDKIYGGTGIDSISAGDGDDLIITIGGGTTSSIAGGNGDDTFWVDSTLTEAITDASANELSDGMVHRVDVFQKLKGIAVSKDLTGGNLTDPTISWKGVSYRNFKNNPLFAGAGPTINDIAQGASGDCYFLAQIASYADLTPELIKQSITELGDGTYAVQYIRGGKASFYRIDADLPSTSGNSLVAAHFGQESSLWVALMEKAWAFFRKGLGTYASIDSGWMSEVSSALGRNSSFTNVSPVDNGATLLDQIRAAIAAGKSVTVGTWGSQPGGSIMVGSHAYSVIGVNDDGAGHFTLTCRNPWSVDGYVCADGVNDGFVTITAAQFVASVDGFSVADV